MNQVLLDHIETLAHVGYIVPELASAVATFKRVYGVSDEAIVITPPLEEDALTRFAFIDIKGTQIELIEPISDYFKDILLNCPSGAAGINHMAYVVNDINAALQTLLEQDIKPGFVTPDGVVDLGHKKMVYLDPQDTDNLLIELIEFSAR